MNNIPARVIYVYPISKERRIHNAADEIYKIMTTQTSRKPVSLSNIICHRNILRALRSAIKSIHVWVMGLYWRKSAALCKFVQAIGTRASIDIVFAQIAVTFMSESLKWLFRIALRPFFTLFIQLRFGDCHVTTWCLRLGEINSDLFSARFSDFWNIYWKSICDWS